MPDRFKVTKTDAPEIDATYHSILKDEEAVLGKLLPQPPPSIDSTCGKKGKSTPFYYTLENCSGCSDDIFIPFPFYVYVCVPFRNFLARVRITYTHTQQHRLSYH